MSRMNKQHIHEKLTNWLALIQYSTYEYIIAWLGFVSITIVSNSSCNRHTGVLIKYILMSETILLCVRLFSVNCVMSAVCCISEYFELYFASDIRWCSYCLHAVSFYLPAAFFCLLMPTLACMLPFYSCLTSPLSAC